MRKEFLLGILCLAVLLLFVTGCVPMPRYYTCPDGSKVLNPDKCIIPEERKEPEIIEKESIFPEEGEEEEEVVEGVISEEAQALFAKISKVNNIQFSYVESPKILPENTYYTSREKMKIDLESKVRFSKDDSYDTVYLDLITGTGVAYCENRDRGICPDRDKVFEVEFEDYFVETPFDWLGRITSAELTGRSQRIENRNAIEVNFKINGEPGVISIDSFFGVPLKVTFKDKKYEFKDMAINEVKPTELEHQFGT